jgi:hypothetical protein
MLEYTIYVKLPTVVSLKIAVFWVVAPCSLVDVNRSFRGPFCLHHLHTRHRENLKSYYVVSLPITQR